MPDASHGVPCSLPSALSLPDLAGTRKSSTRHGSRAARASPTATGSAASRRPGLPSVALFPLVTRPSGTRRQAAPWHQQPAPPTMPQSNLIPFFQFRQINARV